MLPDTGKCALGDGQVDDVSDGRQDIFGYQLDSPLDYEFLRPEIIFITSSGLTGLNLKVHSLSCKVSLSFARGSRSTCGRVEGGKCDHFVSCNSPFHIGLRLS